MMGPIWYWTNQNITNKILENKTATITGFQMPRGIRVTMISVNGKEYTLPFGRGQGCRGYGRGRGGYGYGRCH